MDLENGSERTVKYIDFDLSNCEFKYNFTKDTCYEKATGVCILDEWKHKLSITNFDIKDFRKYPKCVSLYFCLKNKINVSNIPLISRCECGNYVCIDGQHRTCIAKKTNLRIDVEVYKEMSDYGSAEISKEAVELWEVSKP